MNRLAASRNALFGAAQVRSRGRAYVYADDRSGTRDRYSLRSLDFDRAPKYLKTHVCIMNQPTIRRLRSIDMADASSSETAADVSATL